MMALGNRIGVNLTGVAEDALFLPAYGGIVAELKDGAPVPAGLREIGVTTEGATLSACGDESQPVGSAQRRGANRWKPFSPTDATGQAYRLRHSSPMKRAIPRARRPKSPGRTCLFRSFPGTNCELRHAKRRSAARARKRMYSSSAT